MPNSSSSPEPARLVTPCRVSAVGVLVGEVRVLGGGPADRGRDGVADVEVAADGAAAPGEVAGAGEAPRPEELRVPGQQHRGPRLDLQVAGECDRGALVEVDGAAAAEDDPGAELTRAGGVEQRAARADHHRPLVVEVHEGHVGLARGARHGQRPGAEELIGVHAARAALDRRARPDGERAGGADVRGEGLHRPGALDGRGAVEGEQRVGAARRHQLLLGGAADRGVDRLGHVEVAVDGPAAPGELATADEGAWAEELRVPGQRHGAARADGHTGGERHRRAHLELQRAAAAEAGPGAELTRAAGHVQQAARPRPRRIPGR